MTARDIDTVFANLRARRDVPLQRARLEQLGAAAVPRVLEHLDDAYRDLALYALQYCWTEAAVEPVASLLTDPDLEIRRMAAIVLDRHLGREYVAGRCAAHIQDRNPEVAGWCFEHAELMYPDAERARELFAVPHLRWRLARRLPRYYATALASGTRTLLTDADANVVRAAIIALIHHDDGDPAGRAEICAHLLGPQPTLREAAGEYLAWRGRAADLALLTTARGAEADPFARAAQGDAIAAIERRVAAGMDAMPERMASAIPGASPEQAYREALHRLDTDPHLDDVAHARAACATAEPFEPRWFYTGSAPAEGFRVTRRLHDRLLARVLAMRWCESLDPEEAADAAPPDLAQELVVPTRSTFAGEGESFGVHTGADDLAFKSLVHVGADLSWQEDHATVLAIADGIVRAVRCEPSWGYLVIVEHQLDATLVPGLTEYARPFAATIAETAVAANGGVSLCSLYAHLGPFVRVRPGERVQAGQKLGAIGRTLTWENGGYPAHLHFGVHIGPFVQTPLPETPIDIGYRGKRYRGRVLRAHAGGIDAKIRYDNDPDYRVTRTRRWECGYIARWYWDSGAHGWVNPRALLQAAGVQ